MIRFNKRKTAIPRVGFQSTQTTVLQRDEAGAGGELKPNATRFSHNRTACKNCGKDSRSATDRKSTRLNSSHDQISYAVFCLKKKHLDTRPLFLSFPRRQTARWKMSS